MSKIQLLKKYLELYEHGNRWLDQVPHQVRSSFFDNPYCNSLNSINDLLLEECFSEDIVEEILWYLYGRGNDIKIEIGDKVYHIDNVNNFISYLQDQYVELKEFNNATARTFRGR